MVSFCSSVVSIFKNLDLSLAKSKPKNNPQLYSTHIYNNKIKNTNNRIGEYQKEDFKNTFSTPNKNFYGYNNSLENKKQKFIKKEIEIKAKSIQKKAKLLNLIPLTKTEYKYATKSPHYLQTDEKEVFREISKSKALQIQNKIDEARKIPNPLVKKPKQLVFSNFMDNFIQQNKKDEDIVDLYKGRNSKLVTIQPLSTHSNNINNNDNSPQKRKKISIILSCLKTKSISNTTESNSNDGTVQMKFLTKKNLKLVHITNKDRENALYYSLHPEFEKEYFKELDKKVLTCEDELLMKKIINQRSIIKDMTKRIKVLGRQHSKSSSSKTELKRKLNSNLSIKSSNLLSSKTNINRNINDSAKISNANIIKVIDKNREKNNNQSKVNFNSLENSRDYGNSEYRNNREYYTKDSFNGNYSIPKFGINKNISSSGSINPLFNHSNTTRDVLKQQQFMNRENTININQINGNRSVIASLFNQKTTKEESPSSKNNDLNVNSKEVINNQQRSRILNIGSNRSNIINSKASNNSININTIPYSNNNNNSNCNSKGASPQSKNISQLQQNFNKDYYSSYSLTQKNKNNNILTGSNHNSVNYNSLKTDLKTKAYMENILKNEKLNDKLEHDDEFEALKKHLSKTRQKELEVFENMYSLKGSYLTSKMSRDEKNILLTQIMDKNLDKNKLRRTQKNKKKCKTLEIYQTNLLNVLAGSFRDNYLRELSKKFNEIEKLNSMSKSKDKSMRKRWNDSLERISAYIPPNLYEKFLNQ